jgi:hypothetical protein
MPRAAAGQRIALAVNGTLSYLASDLLGSASVALDGTGSGLPTASQLYAPYGGVRYANGTMPTDYDFTGQPSVASCRAVWPPAAPRDRAA